MRLANLSIIIIRGSGALTLVLTTIHLFSFGMWRSAMLSSCCLGFEVPVFWRARDRLVVTSLGVPARQKCYCTKNRQQHPQCFPQSSLSAGLTNDVRRWSSSRRRIDVNEEESFDPHLIWSNPDLVLSHLRARGVERDSLDAVASIGRAMSCRSHLLKEKDAALRKRKHLSEEIRKLMKARDTMAAEKVKERVAEANVKSHKASEEISQLESEIQSLFLKLPNLLDDCVPEGDSEEENQVMGKWGEHLMKYGEEYLCHDDIGMNLGGIDSEGCNRVAGSNFSVLRGPLARLERALGQWFLDIHTKDHGYTEMSVPFIVTRSALEGTGQLPKFQDDLFRTSHDIRGENSFLIPTGEVPLTNLLRGALLEENQLPQSYCALTPCFRAEAGAHGRDTRGLLRQHQFMKVELVKICTREDSASELDILTGHVERVLQLLKLPYRKVLLCSGDTGFSASICYDLEVWLPGQGVYKEVSSCSNCRDFQAKRMGLRYRVNNPAKKMPPSVKTARKSQNVACHTLNGSGIAVGRALVAVLENYYNPSDGSVTVPDVLRPYMGGEELLKPCKWPPTATPAQV